MGTRGTLPVVGRSVARGGAVGVEWGYGNAATSSGVSVPIFHAAFMFSG